MTEEQHRERIKALVARFEAELRNVERGSYAELRAALDEAQADNVPASRFPQSEFRAWGFLMPDAGGDSFVNRLSRRLDRDGWR